MARRKKKQAQKPERKNNIETLLREYARAILQGLAMAGFFDGSNPTNVTKPASDEFLKKCAPELLAADIGAITNLVGTLRKMGNAHRDSGGGNGNRKTIPVALQGTDLSQPFAGYIEENRQLFDDDGEDGGYYDREIDF